VSSRKKKEFSIEPIAIDELRKRGIQIRDLVLYINSSCNLRCKHCYLGNTLLNKSISLNPSSIAEFVRQVTPLDRITVLGGEPLLHKGINNILECVTNSAVKDRRLTTNLTDFFYFDPGRFSKRLRIAVSLDGPDSLIHDQIRGAGTFDRTLKHIRLLLEFEYEIEITHTVTKLSLPRFSEFVELLRSIGITALNLHKISLQGNASENSELFVTPAEWITFRERLEDSSAKRTPPIQVRYPILYLDKRTYQQVMSEGQYHHHASRSFYSSSGGARIVIFPDRKIYISSELFGTSSFIGTMGEGVFRYNETPLNEFEYLSARTSEASIDHLNPAFADPSGALVPVSVSFKRSAVI
jgi:MoaA/NifB/PqqE/SkfB family radical SAM enzyme